jgi:hypothetical protein
MSLDVEFSMVAAATLGLAGAVSGGFRPPLARRLGVTFLAAFFGGLAGFSCGTMAGWGVGGVLGALLVGSPSPDHRPFEQVFFGGLLGLILGLLEGGVFLGLALSAFFSS